MTEEKAPKWLHKDQVLRIHAVALERHGGLPGIRDEGGLESAVFRPLHFFAYGERDLFTFAALYAEGILTNNHPFHDGNKRTGYATAAVFLSSNGIQLDPGEPAERVAFFQRVAAGKISTDELSRFYRDNTSKRS